MLGHRNIQLVLALPEFPGIVGFTGSRYSDTFGLFLRRTRVCLFFMHVWHQFLVCHCKEVFFSEHLFEIFTPFDARPPKLWFSPSMVDNTGLTNEELTPYRADNTNEGLCSERHLLIFLIPPHFRVLKKNTQTTKLKSA